MNGAARISLRAGAPKISTPRQYVDLLGEAFLTSPHGSDEESELDRAFGAACDRLGFDAVEVLADLKDRAPYYAVAIDAAGDLS